MKRVVVSMCIVLMGLGLYARTPVQDLITKYCRVSGAECFEASGLKVLLARPALLATPLAPVSSDVKYLCVLQMKNASDVRRSEFEVALKEALSSYEDYGVHDSPGGPVHVYVMVSGRNLVSELVIFNPGKCTLNDLQGSFSMNDLRKLK